MFGEAHLTRFLTVLGAILFRDGDETVEDNRLERLGALDDGEPSGVG